MANSLNKITTKSILDATVATADIADDAVTADKLANAINTDIAAKMPLAGGTFTGDITIPDKIIHDGDTNTALRFPAADTVSVETGGSERARVDSSGRLLVGHTASEAMFYTGNLQVQGTNSSTSAITVKTNQNDSGGPAIILGKSRGALGGTTVVQDGDELGSIHFTGADGTDTNSRGAAIRCQVDGTPGGNDMPGRLTFLTTADGASTETERMRIESTGDVGIGTSSPAHKLHVESAVSGVISAKQTTNNGGYNIFEGDASDGTTKFYVSHNGRVGAANGIIFGSDTAAANVLEDYEEGGFTPSFNALSTGSIGINGCYYVKVGDLVHFQAYVDFSNTADSDNCEFNAPFSCADSHSWSPFTTQTSRSGTQYPICCRTSQGSTTIQVKKLDGDNAITYSDLNGSWMIFAGTYRTDD